ncbi:MAG: DegV family protein [Chloroflexi bacterium]|nr:DegV family protein [Chloroflexota bacterium]
MARVRIVTDSAARFEDPRFVKDYNVTVVPLNVHFGREVLKDGVDIDAEGMLRRMDRTDVVPRVTAPPVSAFEEVYQDLCRFTDQIVVITHSDKFTDTYANAQTARSSLLGRCEIVVIDSQTSSAGRGYLVEEAAHVASLDKPIDDVIRAARGTIVRLYSVFYVNTLDYVLRAGLIGETQAALGTMLEIKPILTIEDGGLITMEKARTHAQAIDKMIEFVTEFTSIERLCILQNTPRITDRTRMLQDRLALEFSRLQTPVIVYGPLTASQLGPEAMGLAILEGDGYY